jgi:hypothetical protein
MAEKVPDDVGDEARWLLSDLGGWDVLREKVAEVKANPRPLSAEVVAAGAPAREALNAAVRRQRSPWRRVVRRVQGWVRR